jgi:hypothetical protein
MAFRILGLDPAPFKPLFDLPDDALAAIGALRVVADDPRMPCRVSMAHAEPGEELLLLNHAHQPANTPYRSTHAIYVRRSAERAYDAIDTVPEVMTSRLVAVRAFDARHMMIDADVSEGDGDGGADREAARESRRELPAGALRAARLLRGTDRARLRRLARIDRRAGAGMGDTPQRCCRSSFPRTTRRPRSVPSWLNRRRGHRPSARRTRSSSSTTPRPTRRRRAPPPPAHGSSRSRIARSRRRAMPARAKRAATPSSSSTPTR